MFGQWADQTHIQLAIVERQRVGSVVIDDGLQTIPFQGLSKAVLAILPHDPDQLVRTVLPKNQKLGQYRLGRITELFPCSWKASLSTFHLPAYTSMHS